ncbi:hypothetical protein DFH07DRAFT_975751 [Mycena maculata]|uniref:Zn(2)-C6 fungal-type domain-containing protein n=1 Tax=Mycena maculata TaxID=230809 RepID=A0AAD7KGN6_9AGAR|nr:hypothetical protein DFH07DRAFT_975751 [Mycena maculata]
MCQLFSVLADKSPGSGALNKIRGGFFTPDVDLQLDASDELVGTWVPRSHNQSGLSRALTPGNTKKNSIMSSSTSTILIIPRKRAYIACSNCRRRKIKCINNNGESGRNPCERCSKRGLDCEYVTVSEQLEDDLSPVQKNTPPHTPADGGVILSRVFPYHTSEGPAHYLDSYYAPTDRSNPGNLTSDGSSRGEPPYRFNHTRPSPSYFGSVPGPVHAAQRSSYRGSPANEYSRIPVQVPVFDDSSVAHAQYDKFNPENPSEWDQRFSFPR